MIVNVCPAAVTRAPADRIWAVLTTPERFGEWTDATYFSSAPPGQAVPGQVIKLGAPWLRRVLSLTIEVGDMDPAHRWIDLVVRLPFGIDNHEHVTLNEAPEGGTLVRFN